MSSSCKVSNDTVVGGGGTGIVADIEVGVCRFSALDNIKLLKMINLYIFSS